MLGGSNHIINWLGQLWFAFSPIVLVASCTGTMGQHGCLGVQITFLMGWGRCGLHFLPLFLLQAAQEQWDKMDAWVFEPHY